jgi:hypothetical protein
MLVIEQLLPTIDGQRLEINILAHKVLQGGCFRQSPFILFVISFINSGQYRVGLQQWVFPSSLLMVILFKASYPLWNDSYMIGNGIWCHAVF